MVEAWRGRFVACVNRSWPEEAIVARVLADTPESVLPGGNADTQEQSRGARPDLAMLRYQVEMADNEVKQE